MIAVLVTAQEQAKPVNWEGDWRRGRSREIQMRMDAHLGEQPLQEEPVPADLVVADAELAYLSFQREGFGQRPGAQGAVSLPRSPLSLYRAMEMQEQE